MNNSPVLITGINGFIGSALARSMKNKGYEVWGLATTPNDDSQIFQVNLLEIKTFKGLKKKIPKYFILIHTAALAHGQKAPKGESTITANLKMTKNILRYFNEDIGGIIFLSSIAVYGEADQKKPVSVNDLKIPSTDYGESKLLCEDYILKSNIKKIVILRLCPVFNDLNMSDIRKRVFVPGFTSIKMILKPSPEYSLTSIDTVINVILNILSKDLSGNKIFNISDSKIYNQLELTKWFPGKKITIPIMFTKPFYWFTYILPKKYGYKLRCLYSKLFRTNIYQMNYNEPF